MSKIWCDGESYKFFGTLNELNRAFAGPCELRAAADALHACTALQYESRRSPCVAVLTPRARPFKHEPKKKEKKEKVVLPVPVVSCWRWVHGWRYWRLDYCYGAHLCHWNRWVGGWIWNLIWLSELPQKRKLESGPVYFPCKPKIFSVSPITSNL
jgi:hypothetical protein